MARKRRARVVVDDDVPMMTGADFARAKPAAQVMPEVVAAMKRARGRPRLDRPKEHVTLRLDAKVVDAFKADGPGWQARINAVLMRLVTRRATEQRGASRSKRRAA